MVLLIDMVSRHTLCKSISGPMILSPARKHIYLQGHDDTLSRGTSPMNLFQHKTRLHRRSKVLLTTSKIFQSLPKSYRMRYTIVTLFAVLAWQTLEGKSCTVRISAVAHLYSASRSYCSSSGSHWSSKGIEHSHLCRF